MGERVLDTFIDPAWTGRNDLYGGRVVAELAQAAEAAVEMDLLTLMVDFSGSVKPGSMAVRVTPRHVGGRSAVVALSLEQGFERARASAKYGRVGAEPGPGRLPAPPIRSLEDTPPYAAPYWASLPHSALTHVRMAEHVDGVSDLWLRLDPDHPQVLTLGHAARVACLVDAVPPALYFAEPQPAFVPTLDLTMHLVPGVRLPADGWCRARGRLVWAGADFCAEEVALWTARGDLVALAFQNRRVVHP